MPMISVFVSRQLDILAVRKMVERYKEVTGANINFDKSKGLQLGAVWAWPPTGAKLVGGMGQGRSTGGQLSSKAIILKGQSKGVRHVYLPLDPLPLVSTSPA